MRYALWASLAAALLGTRLIRDNHKGHVIYLRLAWDSSIQDWTFFRNDSGKAQVFRTAKDAWNYLGYIVGLVKD